MDKIESIDNYNHGITLIERKSLIITGIKKVENFDSEEFLIDTIMGYLVIKGKDLELLKMDTLQGNISIKGIVNSFSYMDDSKKKDKEPGVFERLFK